MKRSEINTLQREATDFFRAHQFHLPPWAFWSLDQWRRHKQQAQAIFTNKLGWDITDFGSGNFARCGLLLFTLRNGRPGVAGGKDYAEKIMIVRPGQVTPWHFHFHKMEDIINRGGGNLIIELANSSAEEDIAESPVAVQVDGIERQVPARGRVILRPGESITLPVRLYHQFFGDPNTGTVLVGEVSRINDDATDNRFLTPTGRFPDIDEDEPPLCLLCNDYARLL